MISMSEAPATRIGAASIAKIREYLTQNNTTWSKLNAEIVEQLINKADDELFRLKPDSAMHTQADTQSKPRSKKRKTEYIRPRNPLFDILAVSTGCANLEEITESQGRSIGVALAEIKKVSPDLTVEEILRRVECYKSRHRQWALTPNALAAHWSEFGQTDRQAKEKQLDPYICPQDWRELFRSLFPTAEEPAEWSEISIPLRKDILNHHFKNVNA